MVGNQPTRTPDGGAELRAHTSPSGPTAGTPCWRHGRPTYHTIPGDCGFAGLPDAQQPRGIDPAFLATAHHTAHTFGDDGAAPNTCWCRCPSCWDDRSQRCLCPACQNPYHHHGLDGRAS